MVPTGRFSQIKAPVTIVHSNLEQEVIQITEDRLRLTLNSHLKAAEDGNGWIAPLGIMLAIITSFVTTDFRDFILKAPVWEAIFVISGCLSTAWLLYAISRARSAPTVDSIVELIKKGSP